MAKQKWVQPVAEETVIETSPMVVGESKEKPMVRLGAEKKGISSIKEVLRNALFDYAGELSMKFTPVVTVNAYNHNVKSIKFTVVFEDVSENDIKDVIEVGNK